MNMDDVLKAYRALGYLKGIIEALRPDLPIETQVNIIRLILDNEFSRIKKYMEEGD